MKKLFLIIIILTVSNVLLAQTNTWIGGNGNWNTGANWSLGAAPNATSTEDIVINCTCTVTNNAGNLVIDGSLDIGVGSTLDMGGSSLEIGKNNNSAWANNDGTITNSGKISVKGTAFGLGHGPWLFSSGTINATEMAIGNNDGGGVFTNFSTGIVNLSKTGDTIHLDGTLDNQGSMFLVGTLKAHGGDIKGCGYIETPELDIDTNPSGREQNFDCLNVCTSGGGDPVLDIDGDNSYTGIEDAYDNADPAVLVLDPDNTFLCGTNMYGESGPIILPTGPGGVGTTDGTSKLSLWLDAGKITGLSDGANMVTWSDQSGNGNDALVGTAAPSYSAAGGGNGRPAVTFDQSSTENMYVPTNIEVMPLWEVSAFAAGNYEDASNNYGGLISASDDDGRDDGWAIAEANGTGNMMFYVDDYTTNVCTKSISADYGTDHVWNLIFNAPDDLGYGYKSEDACSSAFNGPMNYNGGINDDLLIGAAADNGGPAYYLTGDVEEVIVYDVAVNSAQRIIISNYLAAKYAIILANNDVYDEDDNGDFDFEVAGIGRIDASNIHDDAQGSGIVRILNPTGLGDDEFLLWGHDNGVAFATEAVDVPTGVDARFDRVWRVSESDVSGSGVDVGSIDIRWDLAGKGSITASDLVLLVDTDDDGIFADETPISGATQVSGSVYQFAAVSAIANNYRYTIGTSNFVQTPMAETSPGGIETNLALWLKADAGVTGSPRVATWDDQSVNANNTTASGDPQLVSGAINYNSAIDFDGTDDSFTTAATSLIGATNAYTKIAVTILDNTIGAHNVISAGTGGNHAMFFGNGTANPILYHNGTKITGPAATAGVPSIIANRYGVGGPGNFSRTDGVSVVNNGTWAFTDAGTMQIGQLEGFGTEHDGHIAEAIVYDVEVSDADLLKIESYLAIKYGITLPGNYEASDATVLWDATANAAYHNDVAGIGRDVISGLGQRKSLSINSDGMVIMDKGASFGANLDFILWGNDNGATTLTITDKHPFYDNRLTREWKVSTNGSPSPVTVRMIYAANNGIVADYGLHVDADGTFAAGSTNFIATGISGDTITFNNVSFADGDFFTLGEGASIGPGGVSTNLALWLKAGVGTTGTPTVTAWDDQSAGGNNTTAGGDPQLVSDAINYNSAIDFDAAGDYFQTATTSIIGANNPYTKFGAVMTDNAATGQIIMGAELENHDMRFTIGDNLSARHSDGSISNWGLSTNTIVQDQAHLTGLRYDGAGGLNDQSMLDGNITVDNGTYLFDDVGTIQIGTRNLPGAPQLLWNGYISEAILYTAALSDADLLKIEAYLGIKYGITLDNTAGGIAGDYQASDATLLWDADVNVTYHNDVTGIGRDDKSVLDQQKSLSSNPDDIVIMDKGTSFASDLDFLLWGNDDGATTEFATTGDPTYNTKLQRTWKTAVTGTPGNVTVRIIHANTGTIADYALLVDADGDFSAGAVSYPTPSISGDTITFANIPFVNGDFFSLGRQIIGPGFVGANLVLWLKSDAGVTGAAPVTAWDDQSPEGNNTTAAADPQLVANGINYNPAIDFDGTGDSFTTAATSLIGDDNPYTKIAVAILDNTIGAHNVISAGVGGNHALCFGNGTLNPLLYHGATRITGPAVTVGVPSILANRYDGVPAAPDNFSRTDGLSVADNTAYAFTDAGTMQIGQLEGFATEHDGYIAEAIVYKAEVSDADLLKIESYLAIKYGKTLDNTAAGTAGDYQASDASLLWDADNQPVYHNDVIGIGRDDNSLLSQKQSHSPDDSLIVYIDALAADNAANTGTITNDISYVVIGHDGEKLLGQLLNDITEMPASVYTRFQREWKVTNTNFNESFSLDLEWEDEGAFDINDIRLLVDTDGDFSDATVYGTGGGLSFSYSAPVITITGISNTQIAANSTRYITIASANSATPLPIELVSFNAQPIENGAVELAWQTASETNNDYFTIEKSRDAEDWQIVNTVTAAGNSTQPVSYTNIDENPYAGISYYRLKQTDFDGQYSYSEIRLVNIDDLKSSPINVYPNPTNGQITIEGSKAEIANLRIYDLQGQDVGSLTNIVESTDFSLTLDITTLRKGMYLLKTSTANIKIFKD